MLYRHVFDKISTEFRGISRVFVNFAALLLLKISEALYLSAASFTFYKLATKNLNLVTIFLRLVAKRWPEDFFNSKPYKGTCMKHLEKKSYRNCQKSSKAKVLVCRFSAHWLNMLKQYLNFAMTFLSWLSLSEDRAFQKKVLPL